MNYKVIEVIEYIHQYYCRCQSYGLRLIQNTIVLAFCWTDKINTKCMNKKHGRK